MGLICMDIPHWQSELSCQCDAGAGIHAALQHRSFIWDCHLVLIAGSYIRRHHIRSRHDAQSDVCSGDWLGWH